MHHFFSEWINLTVFHSCSIFDSSGKIKAVRGASQNEIYSWKQAVFYPYQNRVCLLAGRSVKLAVSFEQVYLVAKRTPSMIIPVDSILEAIVFQVACIVIHHNWPCTGESCLHDSKWDTEWLCCLHQFKPINYGSLISFFMLLRPGYCVFRIKFVHCSPYQPRPFPLSSIQIHMFW